MAPVGRQQAIEGLAGRVRERGELSAVADQRVGREHAGAAGIGQDRQARPGRSRLFRQHLGHVEQLGNAVDAKHAAAPERGVEDRASLPVKRAGVRRGTAFEQRPRCGRP